MRIYVDESGYTGEDLWNPDQRVFVVTSTNLTDEEAATVRGECFADIAAQELKHTRLMRSGRGRAAVVRFLRLVRQDLRNRFTVYPVHKRFALTTFMVDLWVEPSMHVLGYDLYERGGNVGLSNLTHLGLHSLLRDDFERLLCLFQRMMIARTRESYSDFWSAVQRAHDDGNDVVKDLLRPFLLAAQHLGFRGLTEMPPRSLNLAFSVALETVNMWRARSTPPFEVYHDRSSNMMRDRWAWDALVLPEVPEQIVGHGGRTFTFPVGVSRTEFVDSATSTQVQLADVLAGAMATATRARMVEAPSTEYARQLHECEPQVLITGGVWPTPYVTPEELETGTVERGSTQDILRFVGGVLGEAASRRRG